MFLSLAAVGLFSMEFLYAKLGGFGCALAAALLFHQVACAYAELHRAEHEQQMTALAELSQKLELQQVMTALEQNRSRQEETFKQSFSQMSTSMETALCKWQNDTNAALQTQADALINNQKNTLEAWEEKNQAMLAEFKKNCENFDASMQGAAGNLENEISHSQEMLDTAMQEFLNVCRSQTEEMQSIRESIQSMTDHAVDEFAGTAQAKLQDMQTTMQPLEESYRSFSETTDRLLTQMSKMSEEDNQLLRDLMKWSDAK
jgi:hypothetical protein